MNVVEGQNIEGTTLEVDNTHFRNCFISNCKVIYRGGRVSWEGTIWADCNIILADAANNTVQVLEGWGFKITHPQGKTFSRSVN